MRKLTSILGFLCIVAGLCTTQSAAQTTSDADASLDSLFGEHAPYEQFFDKLKKAVAVEDKETVASMVDYPFQARIQGKALEIRDQKHFVADYDEIITSRVKDAVAEQTSQTLFANWQGVMIGDGEVWFGGICSDDACTRETIRIIAIND